MVPSAQGNAVVQAPAFDTKDKPAGVGFESETLAASAGPAFVAVIV